MKKKALRKKTRFLCMLLALVMILTSPAAIHVSAADTVDYFTVYPTADAKVKMWLPEGRTVYKDQYYMGWVSASDGKLYTAKSANTSVFSANKKKSFVADDTIYILCTAKKAGKTTLTLKTGKTSKKTKTTSVTVKVLKFTNPLKSMKIGKKTISGKKFNNTSVLRLKYKDYANKSFSLSSLKLKKNWSIIPNCKLITKNGSKYTAVSISANKNGKFTQDDGGALKITKKGSWIEIWVSNSKTHQYESLTILFE